MSMGEKMKEDLEYSLYVISEMTYQKEHKELSEEVLFPFNWYMITNYKLKLEILTEALNKNILIKDTELYKRKVQLINI